ncbi:MAG: vanadium-dependent haloperoxidase, partial [Verrucomicrobiota bacterium]
NEVLLEGIRNDLARPTVHARNLFHVSAAMWDAWAAFDTNAVGYVFHDKISATNVAQARHETISYAAWRVLKARYSLSVNAGQSLTNLNLTLSGLGYDTNFNATTGTSFAALGNCIGQRMLDFAIDDGANESNNYADTSGYVPANEPLIIAVSGTTMQRPNQWQPLAFEFRITQNGLEAEAIQTFIGAHWLYVRPFAMTRPGPTNLFYDPGKPPHIYVTDAAEEAAFKSNVVTVIEFSSRLDPDSGDMIDISPGGPGRNNPLGTQDGTGHPTNPVTGMAYTSNVVSHGDFGRVVAEFWADGPDSETPPGHWNKLANEASEHPAFTRQFEGTGPVLDQLEWDVKMYFAMNAAQHDAATAAWSIKRVYDYVRPISAIRFLASRGQSTDPGQPKYHPRGLPLISNLIEVVTSATTMPGERHAHLAGDELEIAINVWPGEPNDPETEYSGRGWILAEDWLPYQRDTFVTPAFAGYISGHSTFSRAGAEVLAAMTGTPFFPGGMGVYTAAMNTLDFELGPSTDIVLQWGTYYDAADEAGISRLYGGIHPPVDDFPGRIIGSQVGQAAFALARKYFDGTIATDAFDCWVDNNLTNNVLKWHQYRGLNYQVTSTTNLYESFSVTNTTHLAKEDIGEFILPLDQQRGYYRVEKVTRTQTK